MSMQQQLKKLREKVRSHPNSLMLICYLIMMSASSYAPGIATKQPYVFVIMLPLLILVLNIWVRKTPRDLLTALKTIRWRRLLGIVLGVILLMGWLLFISVGDTPSLSKNTANLYALMHHYWYMPLYVLFIAPCLEELTFRSSLYSVISRMLAAVVHDQLIKTIVSYIIVGLAFALIHADNLLGIYAIFSWLLQWITNRYGLKYAVITHISVNTLSLGLTLLINLV